MNIARLSIQRPVFITCIVVAMLAVGFLAFRRLGVDLFPNITFPVVTVYTSYPGAGPQEIETLVSKVIEEQVSSTPGIKWVRSVSREGLSIVIAEFTLETDVKYAEQQVKDKVSLAKRKLPQDIEEPLIRRIEPSEQPVLVIALEAELTSTQLHELGDLTIRPDLEQLPQVGLVEVVGGRKREIHVLVDREKMKDRELSLALISQRLGAAGLNIPAGKVTDGQKETIYRTLGEFSSLRAIGQTTVNFLGNDVAVRLADIAKVEDAMKDESARVFVNGRRSVFINVYRQSGANTIAVTKNVLKRLTTLQQKIAEAPGQPKLTVVRNGAKMIHANVDDVQEAIIIGIILTILVVYLFLSNGRSTFITGLALPNSLLGAFILMAICGFTINTMTLLALSLAVGLLVDDAIVVRENIFRYIELGKSPREAAEQGTREVTLAVVATTLAVIAVFAPIAFLQGIVGQFFKEFGLTICFAMLISLFDAMTVAPMLSAYLAGSHHQDSKKGLHYYTLGAVLRAFNRGQDACEHAYVRVLRWVLRWPWFFIGLATALFVGSLLLVAYVPKTFLPPQDFGEFAISLDQPPGTSLEAMTEVALQVDREVRSFAEVKQTALTVGREGEPNWAEFFVELVPRRERKINTSEFKEILRERLKRFAAANPIVKEIDIVAAGMRPFAVNIVGTDLKEIEKVAEALKAKLQHNPALKDVDLNVRPGKPEVQIHIDQTKAERLGVLVNSVGMELRAQVEGVTPTAFREKGEEYDIRLRMRESQRNLREHWTQIYVPNMNFFNVRLKDFAQLKEATGPSSINRQNRARYIQVNADLAPSGPGMASAMQDTKRILGSEIPLPPGVSYTFVGQAESFAEMIENMAIAMLLAVVFIYLVLSSLYESFVTPLTIMLVLPLAICGAFAALFVTQKSLDLYSMIGCILLLGVAIKNSILLVDFANQKVGEGMGRDEAMLLAGKTRLRPILMTTFALIAGMLPIAIGLNEASAQRTSMGVAVIGGLISSTVLTLVVIPAAYSFIDRFRVWSLEKMKKLFTVSS